MITRKYIFPVVVMLVWAPVFAGDRDIGKQTGQPARAMVGAYYYDGWAGHHSLAGDPNQPWAENAPTSLSKRLKEEFSEREPLWGWRDDSLDIMEKQIDLAADNGLSFFSFCWYWYDDGKAINPEGIRHSPLQTGLNLFMKARNRNRLKFCIMIANHDGFEIKGREQWQDVVEFLLPYLKDPQNLTVDNKPLVLIYWPHKTDKATLDAMQDKARQLGLPGLSIAGCDPKPGPDSPYTLATYYNINLGYSAGPEEHHYAELVAANEAAWKGTPTQRFMPIVTAGWDKRPWEGPRPEGLGTPEGWYFPDRTPQKVGDCVRNAITWMNAHSQDTTKERIVFIYAWNELGEGGFLVPTEGDPNGKFLKAVKAAVESTELPLVHTANAGNCVN